MTINADELQKLIAQFESLLAELDRLQLPIIAAHVDFALQRLKEAEGLSDATNSGSSDDQI